MKVTHVSPASSERNINLLYEVLSIRDYTLTLRTKKYCLQEVLYGMEG
jgi:hypothetical protein